MSGELNTKNVGMEVMSLIGDFLKNHVATATVGKVDIVNSDGTVNVQPLLNLPAIDGTQTVHAVIPNVRILFNANCQLSITVTAGDIVLVVFCKESLGGLSMSGSPANSLLNHMFSWRCFFRGSLELVGFKENPLAEIIFLGWYYLYFSFFFHLGYFRSFQERQVCCYR